MRQIMNYLLLGKESLRQLFCLQRITKRKDRLTISVIGLTVILLVTASARSQGVGGGSQSIRTDFHGVHRIIGRIIRADGTPLYGKTRIRLASMLGGDVIDVTDDEGKFTFQGLRDGQYTVTVDESPDHGAGSGSVDVDGGGFPMARTFYLTIRLTEKKSLTYYNKAIELSKAGDHKGAIEQLNLAVHQDPEFVEALTEIGVQYMSLGELEKADAALAASLKVRPDFYGALVNRGIVLVRLKKYADAEPLLQAAVKANSTSAIAYYYLGRAQNGLGRQDDALISFNNAVKIGGDDAKEAHRMLGSIYLDKQDDKHAIEEFETYLKLNPTAPDADKLRQLISQLKANSPSKPQ
ncbi:MAG: tetratricopeptide repeat protein [Acidobacteria bacterium]|nr:tetratricopeptide repeat protein [Acidobacteriota bacterium]